MGLTASKRKIASNIIAIARRSAESNPKLNEFLVRSFATSNGSAE